MELKENQERIVREAERLFITGVPYATWHKYEKLGEAPKGKTLFGNTKGWRYTDIMAWVNEGFPKSEQQAA